MRVKFGIPDTFEIALMLTGLVLIGAVIFTIPPGVQVWTYSIKVLGFWKKGFWELLEFTMQMVLILVLGHTLALSKPIDKLLNTLLAKVTSNTSAVLTTGITAMAAGFFNWGFGLILGAILAVKIGRKCQEEGIPFNFPLIGASAYLGMMVWHGGISGSAPLKVAESGHFLVQTIGVIPISETVFSRFNILTNAALVSIVIGVLYVLSRLPNTSKPYTVPKLTYHTTSNTDKKGLLLGGLMLLLVLGDLLFSTQHGLNFIDLNYINFLLFALGLVFYKCLKDFVASVGIALKGAVEIILQFPLYAGILGIMKYSGLLEQLSMGFIALGGDLYFPMVTFISASFFNLFVPSGGGQWAIQGPIIMNAVQSLDLKAANLVMVFAYGDQVSNMLQPFWALPLLSITGLPVKEIFKYTALFFLVGFLVFGASILTLL
jgi:short-chain fatty acids transporter